MVLGYTGVKILVRTTIRWKFISRLYNHLEFFLSASPRILDLVNEDLKTKTNQNTIWNASCPKHTIERSETLFTLAFRYGVTVDEINALNPILNSMNQIEGLDIRLPCRGKYIISGKRFLFFCILAVSSIVINANILSWRVFRFNSLVSAYCCSRGNTWEYRSKIWCYA